MGDVPSFLGYEEKELDKNVQEALKEELPNHKQKAIQAYLEHGKELDFLRAELIDSMKN